MFHVLHKVDMRTYYAKQKTNLVCPKRETYIEISYFFHIFYQSKINLPKQIYIYMGSILFRLLKGTLEKNVSVGFDVRLKIIELNPRILKTGHKFMFSQMTPT